MQALQSVKQPDPEGFRARLAPLAHQICERSGCATLLDYRCGDDPLMRYLKPAHRMQFQCYEPSIARFAARPLGAQFVFCAIDKDALLDEEVESVIAEVDHLAGAVCLLAVHETERPFEWWARKLLDRDLQTLQRLEVGFYAIFYPTPERLVS